MNIDTFYEHLSNINKNCHETVSLDESILDHNVDSNPLLNSDFTYYEIQKAIEKLKNNKSCGTDQILNEYLKNAISDCIKLYTKLFNVILNTGIVPEKWVIRVVKPIYKGKSSKTDYFLIGFLTRHLTFETKKIISVPCRDK